MGRNMIEELQECGVDTKGALERFMQRDELYSRFLYKFIQDENFSGLKEAMEQREYSEAFKYAHTLKGVAGNLGLTPIYESVSYLVELLRNCDSEEIVDEGTEEAFKSVEKNYSDVYQIIANQ